MGTMKTTHERQAGAQAGMGADKGADKGAEAQSLRAWRDARQLTQFALAAASGVSLTGIRDLEHARSQPTLTTMRRLAAALGVTLDQIAWPEPPASAERPAERPARRRTSQKTARNTARAE